MKPLTNPQARRPLWARLRLVGPVVAILLAGAAVAQSPPDAGRLGDRVREGFRQQQRENERLLRQYTWKSRTEVRVGGQVKQTVLQLVRYDAGGHLQKTDIGGQPAQAPPARGPFRRLTGRRKQKKADEYSDRLRKLIDSYANIPPDRMAQLMQGAAFELGAGDTPGTVRLVLHDVVNKGDTLRVWLDPATREKRKAEILTSLDGDPVVIETHFAHVPGGPQYADVSTVTVKAKNLLVTTENFDFRRENQT